MLVHKYELDDVYETMIDFQLLTQNSIVYIHNKVFHRENSNSL